MKKYFNKSTILIILTIIFLGFVFYYSFYNIENNVAQIEESIIELISLEKERVTFQASIEIDNKKFVLFTFDDNAMGYSKFQKGLNNKYKIESVGYEIDKIEHRAIDIKDKKYFIVLGRNNDMRIKSIKAIIAGNEYMLDIQQNEHSISYNNEYFITYCEVLNETETVFPQKFILYDMNNNDITEQIYR